MSFSCKHNVVFALLLWIAWYNCNAQTILAIREAEVGTYEVYEKPFTAESIRELLAYEIKKGFVFASIDTVKISDDTLFIQLYRGTEQSWYLGAQEAGGPAELLKDLANEGYPFASVVLDSLKWGDNQIEAIPLITKGPRVVFDTISINGDVRVSKKYLHVALGFQPGDLYAEKKYERIPSRLRSLDLLRLTAPPDIGFSNGKAIIYLKAEKIKSDQFEGILGLLPRAGGGSTVTGYLNLDLNNLFRSGKSFFLNWNRFSESAQQLELKYRHPFILGSRVSIGTELFILRQDSLFTKRHFGLDLQVPLASDWYLGLSLRTAASDIQAVTPDARRGLDYRLSEYRPALGKGSMKEIFRYEQAFGFRMSMGLADKRIRRNSVFPDEVYDTVSFRSNNYQFDLSAQLQHIWMKRSAIYSRLDLGLLEGSELVRNEFYRIGGLKSLRGFNENLFFVSSYFKMQTEYRLFFASRSFLILLWDMALLDLSNAWFDEWDFFHACGGGLSLDTNNGNFNFIFALGLDDQTNLDVRNTKIHFGYNISF